MQVANPTVAAEVALADKPTPFLSPVTGAPASEPGNDYADHLSMLVKYFEESEDMTRRARELAERDRDYHDNFDDSQWSSKEKEILRKRGQPVTTSNYIKRKVATLKGGEMRMRSDPKAFPRNPQDEETADTATMALRYIGDQNKFNVTRSKVYENFLIEGFGGADVVIEPTKNEKRVKIIRVPWDRLFYDPHSSAEDFSNAKYKGVVIWRDAHKDDQDALGATIRSSGTETYDDRPKTSWVDSKRKRVRVVQIHYLHEGEWMVATFTKEGFIEDPVISPYKDRDGNSCCSLIMRSAYVDRENNRFGACRDWISTQEVINKRESKGMHLLNSRQTFGNAKAVSDDTQMKTEMAKPDGHIKLNADAEWGKDVGVVPTADMARGNFEMQQRAVAEMQDSGPNAAMAGKAPGQQSGRALEAQMQAGSVEMEPLVDELRQWTRDIYEAAWLRARQFWTDETWVRVTDDDRNIKFVGLNKKVTLADKLAQTPEELRAMYMQQNQIQPNDPRLQEVVDIENDISGLDVDIEVEEGPDISTLQSEQFEIVSELARSGVPLRSGKPIPLESLIELSSLRNKDKFLKSLDGDGEDSEANALKQQMSQMGQQMEQMNQELVQMKGDLSIKAAEAETKQFAAETDRMELVAPAMTPQDIAAIVTQTMQQVMTQGAPPAQPQQPQMPPQEQMQGQPPI